jgi:hypothetical protein
VTGKQQKASEIWNRKKAMKVEKKRFQKKMKKLLTKIKSCDKIKQLITKSKTEH